MPAAISAKRQCKRQTGGIIRPYQSHDRQAVRDIACRTAFRNRGFAVFVEDRTLHADYWTRYYTDFIPHEVKVVEQEGEVIGYFFGCPDHAHHTRIMARHILPRVLGRAFRKLATFRYRQPQTRRYLQHMLLHGVREAPRLPYDRYPATYHCNILRKGYGRGYYSTMALDYLDDLARRGITGIHGHITEPAVGGIWLRMSQCFGRNATDVFNERPTGLYRAVLGDLTPMVNRGWAVRLPVYRHWIEWLRDTRRL